MLKSIITTTACLITFLLPIKALTASLSDIIVFGDSFVDDGNFFEVSKTVTPDTIPPFPGPPYPNEPYFKGRFSNGLLWTELLGEKIGANYNSDNNFAFGGAGTGRVHRDGAAFSSLLTQVDNYTNNIVGSADPNALYIISAGPNDPLTTPNDIANSIGNLSEAIVNLSQVGAKNFLVADLPDLGSLPLNFNLPEPIKDSLSSVSNTYNQNLAISLQNIEQNSDLNILSLDINTLFDEVKAKPDKFGFKVFSEAGCFNLEMTTVCDNPNEYVYWDLIHPSAASQKLIADLAAAQVHNEWGDDDDNWGDDDDNWGDDDDKEGNKNVPETSAPLKAKNVPETSYPLSLFAFLGLLYVFKSKYKKKM